MWSVSFLTLALSSVLVSEVLCVSLQTSLYVHFHVYSLEGDVCILCECILFYSVTRVLSPFSFPAQKYVF